MVARVVKLGSARRADEGLRIGTVRRPPRGVPKAEYAARNWYDCWYPELAPSAETVALGRSAVSEAERAEFARRYRREMAQPHASRTLDLLAALSHHAQFSVGCYCDDATRCHRRLLRDLLVARGAAVVDEEEPPAAAIDR